MTPIERTTTISLASIFVMRLLGLFMVLPVLSLYAQQLKGSTPTLIGLSVGIYGVTQAILQIPCGMLSDRYNRKLIIAGGFLIFIIGSIIAAISDSIFQLLIGRALQGASAVGGATIALATDLTEESQRPKAMAVIGISIGASFSLAMMLGPFLNTWLHVNGLFWLSAGLGLTGLAILRFIVPAAPPPIQQALSSWQQLVVLLKNPALIQINVGVFILHAILTANFVILPFLLGHRSHLIYILVLSIVILFLLPLLKLAQKKTYLAPLTLGAIGLLVLAESVLSVSNQMVIGLIMFFTAFTFLEASLPSLTANFAPVESRGSAMGIYFCSQFLGIFFGGLAGGWLYGRYTPHSVFIFCAMLATLWFLQFFFTRQSNHGTRH